MATSDDQGERRRFRRADIMATAVGVYDGGCVSRYLVQNLSAGGALLSGRRSAPPGEHMRLLLELPGEPTFGIHARIVRVGDGSAKSAALGVSFDAIAPEAQGRIQELVAEALTRQREPGVLVIEDEPEIREKLEHELVRLGWRVCVALTPLDAVRLLEQGYERINAALVDVAVHTTDGPDFMGFLAAEYPAIRRVMLQRNAQGARTALAKSVPPEVDNVLADPWDSEALTRLLA